SYQSRPIFRPAVWRLTDTNSNHLRPTRLAPFVKPPADHFRGCVIVSKNIVEMLVIERAIDELFEFRKLIKITDEANAVERGRLQLDLDLIVVAVQPSARVIVRKAADNV